MGLGNHPVGPKIPFYAYQTVNEKTGTNYGFLQRAASKKVY